MGFGPVMLVKNRLFLAERALVSQLTHSPIFAVLRASESHQIPTAGRWPGKGREKNFRNKAIRRQPPDTDSPLS